MVVKAEPDYFCCFFVLNRVKKSQKYDFFCRELLVYLNNTIKFFIINEVFF